MINPFSRGFLLDRAGEPAVADAPPKIDPGAPFFHDDKPTEKQTPKPEKSAVDKEVERLTAELKASKDESKRLADSEKYWSDRARNQRQPEPELEPEPEPELDKADPFEGEKPEKFLDDLSTEGKVALFKRGVITEKQLTDSLKNLEANVLAKVDEKLADKSSKDKIDADLAREFPEVFEDVRRVARGEEPSSPIYTRASAIYKEMLEVDPSLKKSPAALMLACRTAKKEVEMEAKRNGDRQSDRRARIAATNPDRDAAGNEGGDEVDQLSPTQRTIVNSLSRFGVTEETFRENNQPISKGKKY